MTTDTRNTTDLLEKILKGRDNVIIKGLDNQGMKSLIITDKAKT
jgi:hypothetical protein